MRDDISLNYDALTVLNQSYPEAQFAFVESGGDNLSATFSPDLVDYQIYIIDVAQGGDIPKKGGIGIGRSDFLIVNKTDLAPYVEVDLAEMENDVAAVRGPLPYVFANLKKSEGLTEIVDWLVSLLDKDVNENKNPLWSQSPTLKSGKVHHHHHEH